MKKVQMIHFQVEDAVCECGENCDRAQDRLSRRLSLGVLYTAPGACDPALQVWAHTSMSVTFSLYV